MTSPELIKQQQDLRGMTPILTDILLWVKCYQAALHATNCSQKEESRDVANFTVVLF